MTKDEWEALEPGDCIQFNPYKSIYKIEYPVDKNYTQISLSNPLRYTWHANRLDKYGNLENIEVNTNLEFWTIYKKVPPLLPIPRLDLIDD